MLRLSVDSEGQGPGLFDLAGPKILSQLEELSKPIEEGGLGLPAILEDRFGNFDVHDST